MNDELGIVYVATGEKYLAECVRSASSAKKIMPEVPITLWTDGEVDQDNQYRKGHESSQTAIWHRQN